MIAATTASDVIVIILFATVLFLVFVGLFSSVRALVRFLRGFLLHTVLKKPVPHVPQGLSLVFELDQDYDPDADDGGQENRTFWNRLDRFTAYLDSRLHGEGLGGYDSWEISKGRLELLFIGPDARRMLETLEPEVMAYGELRPLEAAFIRGKKQGGREIHRLPPDASLARLPLPHFQPPDRSTPAYRSWGTAFMTGVFLTVVGFLGLFLSSLGRKVAGLSEAEAMRSGSGGIIIFGLSGMFLVGMVICLTCVWYDSRSSQAATSWQPDEAPLWRRIIGWVGIATLAAVIVGILIFARGW